MSQPRLISFLLPQFHPIPENDLWWGKGFTEWTNVTRAQPLFPGHHQPQLPADLGFYDLRLPEARAAQADLAEYGLHGFCYYHYWFNGRRLLERPFNEVLASGKPDFPFCLCWANENWTRRWDGLDAEILLGEQYSPEDDRRHLQSLAPALRDPRNIRIDGKALFLVYRTSHLPNPRQTAEIWRDEARKQGVGELFLCTVDSSYTEHVDPASLGFDAAVEFQPDWTGKFTPAKAPFWPRLFRKIGITKSTVYTRNTIYEYDELVRVMLNKPAPAYRRFPCVAVGFDNAARRKTGATVFRNATPESYGNWLSQVIEREKKSSPSPVIFINAWNEWAEGNHLEPDLKFGRLYLEATRRALGQV